MIGHCELHKLLLRRVVLRSIAKGVATLPAKTHKELTVRQLAFRWGIQNASIIERHLNRFRSYRLCAMSSSPQSSAPAALAENGAHDDDVEALRRQVHELQVEASLDNLIHLIAERVNCPAIPFGHLAPNGCASTWPKSQCQNLLSHTCS